MTATNLVQLLKTLFARRKKIAELEREIERLEKVVNDPVLAGIEVNEGGVNMMFKGAAPNILAGMFVGILDENPDAQNYITFKFFHERHGLILITVQRYSGKTPHELRKEAEAKLEEAEKKLEELSK